VDPVRSPDGRRNWRGRSAFWHPPALVVPGSTTDRSRIDSLHDAQPVGVLGISFSVLGALIVSRQPGNRIGWIYLLIGVLTPLQALTVV
jgi:hypothetical protein